MGVTGKTRTISVTGRAVELTVDGGVVRG